MTLTRRVDREADGARLESVCVERHHGFESHTLRQNYSGTSAGKRCKIQIICLKEKL